MAGLAALKACFTPVLALEGNKGLSNLVHKRICLSAEINHVVQSFGFGVAF